MDDTSYSTGGLQDRSFEASLETIADAGFPQLEVLDEEPHIGEPPVGKALLKFRRTVEIFGLRARTVHTPAGETVLGTTNKTWQREALSKLEGYIRFAGSVSATSIVIHPVPNPVFVPDVDDPSVPQKIQDGLRSSLDHLVPIADSSGLLLTLENLPYRVNFPFLTMKELRRLINDYPNDRVGLVIHIGHVGVLRMDPVSEIRSAGSRLCGTHVHDVDFSIPDGDHRPPIRRGFDWDPILNAFEEIEYPGPWTFESSVLTGIDTKDDVVRITRETAIHWGLT